MLWGILIKGPRQFFKVQQRDSRPDLLDHPNFGTHGFARLKRIKLHYVAKGSESKPLMLFLHGFPEFWYSWRHQLKEFGGDYRAVAVDMRGYGESDKPRAIKDYTMDKLVADIKELIPALGHEKCILVGHDWGGAVAWSFAHMYPNLVEKLIVCNCPHFNAFEKLVQKDKKQFLMSWYMMFFQMPCVPEAMMRSQDLKFLDQAFLGKRMGVRPGKMSQDDMEMFKYNYSQEDALRGPIHYYRANLRYLIPLQYPSKKVQVPSLMVWGTNDAALSVKLADMTGDCVEDYRVRLVHGASHWVQQEEPEEVNKYIRQFVTGKLEE